jgi:hypothetical protein
MSLNQPVHRIAIVGTGVIGASWVGAKPNTILGES